MEPADPPALWRAEAAGAGAVVEAIDQFDVHVDAARRVAEKAGLSERLRFITGEGGAVLRNLDEVYDLSTTPGSPRSRPTSSASSSCSNQADC
ncbi:MAG: hypothetical protein M3069_21335 [Chloroflexota bacterium]|nr:hypothetical protein [Chloroflexota bacterium]